MEKEKTTLLISTERVKTLDDFLHLGKYCFLVLLLGEFLALTCLVGMTFMVYAGARPKITECIGSNFNGTDICASLTELRRTTNCEPKLEYQFRSVNVDFDLLCENGHEVRNSISFQMLGVLIGAALFGQMSDSYGRKKAMLLSTVGMTIFSLLTAFSTSLLQFTVLRTINGLFTGGLAAVQSVYLIENIPRKHRMWIQTVVAWSPHYIIFPYAAYLCHDWSTLAVFNAAIAAITTLLLLIVHESPRWLVQKGRMDEARDVFTKIQKIDGPKCDEIYTDLEKTLQHEEKQRLDRNLTESHTFYHLFCTWRMVSWSMTLIFGMVFAALINYALFFSVETLSGSMYWNGAIFGIIRWVINIGIGAADYYVSWFGRRLINQTSLLMNVVLMSIMSYYLWEDPSNASGWVVRVGTILAMSVCSQLFLAKYLTANELYPTAVRNLAISSMSTSSRIGTILAPQLFLLREIASYMPYLVCMLLSAIDFILFQLFVPETKGKHLENHLPPREKWIINKKKLGKEESC